MYEGALQHFYYIFSYIFRHSPGNSGRNLVFCLCATTKCCVKLSCCILCTPLFMLGPPLPVCQELPSTEPDPERVLCTCSLPARGRAPMLQNTDETTHTIKTNCPHLLGLCTYSEKKSASPQSEERAMPLNTGLRSISSCLVCTMACS